MCHDENVTNLKGKRWEGSPESPFKCHVFKELLSICFRHVHHVALSTCTSCSSIIMLGCDLGKDFLAILPAGNHGPLRVYPAVATVAAQQNALCVPNRILA